jgi:hypothetical protein
MKKLAVPRPGGTLECGENRRFGFFWIGPVTKETWHIAVRGALKSKNPKRQCLPHSKKSQ